MKAAQLVGHREPLVIGEFPRPKINADEVLVRIDAVGICRTDWHLWNGDWEWVNFKPPLPVIPGHEFAGTVVEVGTLVTQIHEGDLVTVPFHCGCGQCESCLAGYTNLCHAHAFPGFTHSGAYGQYVAISKADLNCVVLPSNVDAVSGATLGCRYMSAYRAVVRQGRVRPGQTVAIYGAGGMGLAAVQISKQAGAHLIVVDRREQALKKATAEGADVVINAADTADVAEAVREATGGGAHVAIDAVGGQETTLNALASLRRAGRFVQAGLTTQEFKGNITVPIDLIVALELEVVGSFGNPRGDYQELLAMVERGDLNPSSLVERRASIDEINSILQDLDNFNTLGVVVINSF